MNKATVHRLLSTAYCAETHFGSPRWIGYLLRLLFCMLLSILAGSLIVLCVGENPITVYRLLFQEAFFSPLGLMIGIQRATPLIFTSVAAR